LAQTRKALGALALSLPILFCLPATAWPVTIRGMGANEKCDNWLIMRKNSPAQDTAEAIEKAWILGYLSGAMVYGDGGDILKAVTSDNIWNWLDQYCAKHGNATLNEALDIFVKTENDGLNP
jgi:hypothetical protein